MFITDKTSLAELLFKRDFFQENPKKITRIFHENIPSVCKKDLDNLAPRVENLLTSFDGIDERMELLQSLLFKYPKFLKISLYQLERQGHLKEILEAICSRQKRDLLDNILRNCDMETVELLLSQDRFYVLYRILLRNDVILIDKIPPHLFFKVLVEASVKDRELLLSYLTLERLVSWKGLYCPKVIQDTLWTFTEILKCDERPAPGIQSVFLKYKDQFSIACLESLLKLSPAQIDQIEKCYVSTCHPELLKITHLFKEKPITSDKLASLSQKLSPELIALIFKTDMFVQWLHNKGDFARPLFLKMEQDPQFLDLIHSPTPQGSSLFLHLVLYHHSWMKNILSSIDYFSVFLNDNSILLDQNIPFDHFPGRCEPHLLENPYVITHLCKNSIPIGLDNPVMQNALQNQTFCLDEGILELLEPEKIRKFFLILLPNAKEVTETTAEFIIADQTHVMMNFSEYLTIFFLKNYFPVRENPNVKNVVKAFLSKIPLKFYLAAFARPCLRNYLVELFSFLEPKVQKMLAPLLKDFELYELCEKGNLDLINQILDYIHPDQKDVFEEYAPQFFRTLDNIECRQTLENLDLEEEILNKLLAITKAPTNSKKIPLYLEKILEFRRTITSSLEECPIMREIPRDPAIIFTIDGYEKQVYEREALVRWVIEHKSSPSTRRGISLEDIRTYDFRKKAEYENKMPPSNSLGFAPYYDFPRLFTSVFINLFHSIHR